MKLRSLVLVLLLFLAAPLSLPAQDEPNAPPKPKEETKKQPLVESVAEGGGPEDSDAPIGLVSGAPRGWGFGMQKHAPTIFLGRWGTIGFRSKVQVDFRTFDPEQSIQKGCGALSDADGCLFELRAFRIGIKGLFLKDFDYQVERELKQGFFQFFPNRIQDPPKEAKDPWRDVYVNFHRWRAFEIIGGKFKLPFGLEALQGDADKDFIYVSRASDELTPGRDVGIELHGRVLKKSLGYQAGLFKNDGDSAATRIVLSPQDIPIGDFVPTLGLEVARLSGTRTFAGRVSVTPFRWLGIPLLKKLELGTAFTDSALPPGRKGLRGRTVFGNHWFDHVFVQGHRRRYSAELNWTPGAFALRAEFLAVTDQRLHQGLRGGDLTNLLARGWYVTGAWMLTQERRANFTPRRPFRYFLVKGGPGAVELAVRLEALRFGSAEHPGLPSRSFRAPNILGNSDRAATFGINWYLNRWVKVQFNVIREHIEDPPRRPVVDPLTQLTGPDPTWSRVVRIQFALK